RPRVLVVWEDDSADRDVVQERFGDGGLLASCRVQDGNHGGAEKGESGGRSEPEIERGGRTVFGCGEDPVQLRPDVKRCGLRVEGLRWGGCPRLTIHACRAVSTTRSGSLASRSTGRSPPR